MEVLTYYSAFVYHNQDPFPSNQITMLSTGDEEADVRTLLEKTRVLMGKTYIEIAKFTSSLVGNERHPDGKEMFRLHNRQAVWAFAPQDEFVEKPLHGGPGGK